MIDWYHIKHRKPVPFKHTIDSNIMGYVKESNKFFGRNRKELLKRVIRKTYINDYMISTVFLGLDHGYSLDPNTKPVLFETMVFEGGNELDCTRCCTHREALKMHWAAVENIKYKQVALKDEQ